MLDSLFYFFLPLLPGQDSASANFGHELLTINDIADVNPLADHPFGIAGPDIEGELTPFDFGQHGGCDDFGTDAVRYPMFWVKFDQLRPFLAQQYVFLNDDNNLARYSLDDYFTLGMYDGDIVTCRKWKGC